MESGRRCLPSPPGLWTLGIACLGSGATTAKHRQGHDALTRTGPRSRGANDHSQHPPAPTPTPTPTATITITITITHHHHPWQTSTNRQPHQAHRQHASTPSPDLCLVEFALDAGRACSCDRSQPHCIVDPAADHDALPRLQNLPRHVVVLDAAPCRTHTQTHTHTHAHTSAYSHTHETKRKEHNRRRQPKTPASAAKLPALSP
eukprot:1517588-Rhodomonas_salina.2